MNFIINSHLSRPVGEEIHRHRNGRKPYCRENIAVAVEQIKRKQLSIRQAAVAYQIPRTSLTRQLTRRNFETRLGRPTALSTEDELAAAKWARFMAAAGFPVTCQGLLEAIGNSLRKAGKSYLFMGTKPSTGWWAKFKKRHNLTLRTPEDLDRGKYEVTEAAVRGWFSRMSDSLRDRGVEDILKDPSRIFNADETGIALDPSLSKVSTH